MSKSFREKKSRERDVFEVMQNRKQQPKNFRRKEKVVSNALRNRDIETLVRFTEDDE